jgi:hypothetical protein
MRVQRQDTRRGTPTPRYYPRTAAADKAEFRRAGWAMFRIVVIGKALIMLAIIVVALSHVDHTGLGLGTVLVLNWLWLLPLAVFGIGPAWYWLRLYRIRRRRAALIHAEWHLDR